MCAVSVSQSRVQYNDHPSLNQLYRPFLNSARARVHSHLPGPDGGGWERPRAAGRVLRAAAGERLRGVMPRDRRQGEKTGKIEVEELRPLLIVVRVLFYMWCCTCGAVRRCCMCSNVVMYRAVRSCIVVMPRPPM